MDNFTPRFSTSLLQRAILLLALVSFLCVFLVKISLAQDVGTVQLVSSKTISSVTAYVLHQPYTQYVLDVSPALHLRGWTVYIQDDAQPDYIWTTNKGENFAVAKWIRVLRDRYSVEEAPRW